MANFICIGTFTALASSVKDIKMSKKIGGGNTNTILNYAMNLL